MKSSFRVNSENPKAFKTQVNFDDLDDDRLQHMRWTKSTLMKAMPKGESKIRKMKSH